ncbi:MAG: glycine--tRNA ligase subunit beta [Pseudomonadota bacterium]|nr:glycine--tRNA ligase subunit beta [Pseudomonadota bacterium]
MAELLLEILCQEIPSRMQSKACEDLKQSICRGLKDHGLEFTCIEAYVTPRRLTVMVDGMLETQPDIREERRGPRIDAPKRAIDGFLSSNGIQTVEECEQRETEKGTFLFAILEQGGLPTIDILPKLITDSIERITWPKSMRWGENLFRWVRPIHSLMALFNGIPVKGALDLQGEKIPFGTVTSGHRFMAPNSFEVKGFDDYCEKLKDGFVILDPDERKRKIKKQLSELARKAGLHVKEDNQLLSEVAGLVEWPVPLIGDIDTAFMSLPPEVLTTAIRTHLKYFLFETSSGDLAPHFATVANIMTKDQGRGIITGNERVLRARLSDACFFWDKDRENTLASRVPALSEITFHDKLGSLTEKVERMQHLADVLALHFGAANASDIKNAIRLCKTDLVTQMVGEFPELQGKMGRYYALNDGESDQVAEAIANHYRPQGRGDTCPSAPVSITVGLADRLDTLAGFWAIDDKPTGSKDPYALRRAALGTIRLIVENELRIPLRPVFVAALKAQNINCEIFTVAHDLLSFFVDRLKVHLREEGVRHDLISAIFALGDEDDLVRLLRRVDALAEFVNSDDGENLLVAFNRAANILTIEEKRDGREFSADIDATAFVQDEEKELAAALVKARDDTDAALSKEDYVSAMRAMAALRTPVDNFFNNVTVNTNDTALRINRLKLLSGIRQTTRAVADFKQIGG